MNGYRLEPQEHIQDLRDVSSAVNDYLDRELFLDEYGPDYTIQDILSSCYAIALSDLQNLGITPIQSIDEIVTDYYICKRYYYLLKILQPASLLIVLDTTQIVDQVETMMENQDNFSIVNLLEYLQEMHPKNFDLDQVKYIQDEITNDSSFNEYIIEVCHRIKEGDTLIPTPDQQKAKAYIEKMRLNRIFVGNSVARILRYPELEGKVNMEYISQQMRIYDLDKLTAEDLQLYSTVDGDDVPESLQRLSKIAELAHHQRAAHHIEYWIANNAQSIPKEALILIVATLFKSEDYHLDSDLTEYKNRIKKMISQAGDRLSAEDIKFIWNISEYPAKREIDITD